MKLSYGKLQIPGLHIMVNKMAKVFLCLGSNLGDREANLNKAINLLKEKGIKITKKSTLYETEPVEMRERDWFHNQVIEVETNLEPEDLLVAVKKIERAVGREFTYRYGPRIIDIDILIYEGQVVNSSILHIPHVRMHERKFVLVPFNEIAPEVLHPVQKKSIKELLNECSDAAIVRQL